MERSKFDELTKALSSASNRRTALRAGVAAAAASLGIVKTADAAVCRDNKVICRKDDDCCTGICGEADRTGRRRCGCTSDAQCQPQYDWCENGYCHSCFVTGTRVAMADGTSRPIELVGFGDLVLGENGAVSRVIGVETPLLGMRKLYGLNGGAPFVTAEHPFMTSEGWKSLDPNATYAEQPNLPVDRLQVGDSLVELAELLVPALVGGAEPVGIQTRRVSLTAIQPTIADPATQLYNLLLDGDHTYFANELLVHNKG